MRKLGAVVAVAAKAAKVAVDGPATVASEAAVEEMAVDGPAAVASEAAVEEMAVAQAETPVAEWSPQMAAKLVETVAVVAALMRK